jgi:AraC-like DNA-binding protein
VDAATPGLPVLRSSEYSVPSEYSFDVFHDANAPVFDSYAPDVGSGFRLDTTDYLVDDVLVCRLDTGPHTIRRTADHLRDGTTDWVTVQLHHTGGIRGAAGGSTALDLGPGKVAIVDLSEPLTGWSRGGVSTWVSLPRHRIADRDRLPAVRILDRSSLRGRLLESAILELWRQLPYAPATEADQLAGAFAETVNAVLAADRFMPADRDLAVAMRDFVNVNLGDLDLGVETLQATFHCSRATVYRLFEPQGGVGAYIRGQRLMRCFAELTGPTEGPRLVSDVATRWGFENPSHFNRLFKSEFGLAPSRLNAHLGGAQRSSAQPEGLATRLERFHSWARGTS